MGLYTVLDLPNQEAKWDIDERKACKRSINLVTRIPLKTSRQLIDSDWQRQIHSYQHCIWQQSIEVIVFWVPVNGEYVNAYITLYSVQYVFTFESNWKQTEFSHCRQF